MANKYDIIILIAIMIFSLVVTKNRIDKFEKLSADEQVLKKEIDLRNSQNKYLKEKTKVLASDYYIELIARSKLAFVKDGETAYKIVENK